MRIALTHRIFFRFERPWMPEDLCLRLQALPREGILSSALRIQPEPERILRTEDPDGNPFLLVRFIRAIPELQISVDILLDPPPCKSSPDPFRGLTESEVHFPVPGESSGIFLSLPGGDARAALEDFCEPLLKRQSLTPAFALACAVHLRKSLRPIHRMDPILRDPIAVLSRGTASPAEMAHILVLSLRRFGFPSRFVSGYFVRGISDQDQDPASADLRAWAEIYHPLTGWVGLDPLEAAWVGAGHIRLAAAADPAGANPFPVSLSREGTEFSDYIDVQLFRQSRRQSAVEDEKSILAATEEAERRLRRAGLRFQTASAFSVTVPSPHAGAEGSPASDLTEMRRDVALRLRERLGQGSLPVTLYEEPAMAVVFRDDGDPLWKDEGLLGIRSPAPSGAIPGGERLLARARRLMEALAARLKIDPTFIIEGYEDPLWHLMIEGELPPELDMDLPDIREGKERRRLMGLLDRGLQTPAGFALPLGFDIYSNRWNTCSWKFRRGRLYLLPGTDPMGIRLPLRSISDHFANAPIPDPFFRQPPLSQSTKHLYHQEMVYTPVHQAHPIETALCVEIRDENLYVFLPAIDRTEAWIELVAAVERCAAKIGLPVFLEAIRVPVDHRLRLLRVKAGTTPGETEIELPFLGGPEETAAKTIALAFEDIPLILSRHRLLLGNAVPEESPFFARPDLLARFLRFWHCHPAFALLLSSGEGPSAAHILSREGSTLIREELELGLRFLAKGRGFPWDVHRALQFGLSPAEGDQGSPWLSIAEIYDPDEYSRRRGCLTMGSLSAPGSAFEWRLQIAVLLSVLALMLEDDPHGLAPFGDDLYDRALLPFFVRRDLAEVLLALRSSGIVIEESFFEPLFERKFPVLGHFLCEGISVELQRAIEPILHKGSDWTERIQIRVSDWNADRYQLICNGALVPLHPTGVAGEYVAAIRYQGPQSRPAGFILQIDVYDPWNHRSIGGGTLHPGEAQFEIRSHSVGRLRSPALVESSNHPHTLDLRFLP